MSRRNNPEIKIVYPDASPAAILLTEAIIKRSSGKRVVETNSEEKEYNGQELFAGALACKTDTSVELTLRLNPDAMDYALTTLIAKNLTEEERRSIRMETNSMEVVDLLSPCAGEAAGHGPALEQSAARPAQPTEVATQSGEQETCLWMAAALGVLLSLTSNSPAGKKSTWRQMAYIYLSEPEPTIPAGAIISREEIDLAFEVAEEISHEMNPTSPYIVNPEELLARVLEKIKPETQDKTKTDNSSWEDVEKGVQSLGQHKTNETDKTGEEQGDLGIEIEENKNQESGEE